MNFRLIKVISFAILLITLSSFNQWSSLPLGNTFMWWAIYSFILYIFYKGKYYYYDSANDKNIVAIKWYLIWNIICVVRGFAVAENYWEWKNLVQMSMVLLLPLSIYVTTNEVVLQSIIKIWLKYALPCFFLFAPFFSIGDAIGAYLSPIGFLLLFFPILSKKWKIIVLFFAFIVIFGDLDARSNVIKIGIPLLFSLIYYIRIHIINKIFEVARLLLIAAPILLFFLGVSGIFNVFKIDEYVTGDYKTTVVEEGASREANLTDDTRTALYVEVLSSAIKYDYIVFGRTPARGNESTIFGAEMMEALQTDKMERFSNEVSVLNIFTWTGVIGVILYFMVFYWASYMAVNRSKSKIMKIIGLVVAFRWSYAWVEDFSEFNLSYFFLWGMIGMCLSNTFREMTDEGIKEWIKGVFRNRNTALNSGEDEEANDLLLEQERVHN